MDNKYKALYEKQTEVLKRSKIPTTVNLTVEQRMLLDDHPVFKLSEWLRSALTKEVIEECISNGVYVWKDKRLESA